jgi:hypothetical protein
LLNENLSFTLSYHLRKYEEGYHIYTLSIIPSPSHLYPTHPVMPECLFSPLEFSKCGPTVALEYPEGYLTPWVLKGPDCEQRREKYGMKHLDRYSLNSSRRWLQQLNRPCHSENPVRHEQMTRATRQAHVQEYTSL